MVAGEVADNTRELYRVTSDRDVLIAVDAWDEYFAEFELWLEGNPGMQLSDYKPVWEEESKQIAPDHAAVADREVITDKEALFVEVRFFMDHDDGSPKEAINAPWCQLNSTNIPGLVNGDFAVFPKVFNARRTRLGGDPPA